MIRKILFFIILFFISGWFAGAYFTKVKTVALVKSLESDSIKITYDDVRVLGFPKLWKIKFINPKVQLPIYPRLQTFSAKEILCTFDPSFKKVKLAFGYDIKQTENFHDQMIENLIISNQPLDIMAKFSRPLYQISFGDSLKTIIKSVVFNNETLIVKNNDKIIFELSDLLLSINKNLGPQKNENIMITLRGEYKGEKDFWHFTHASFDMDSRFESENIKINHFVLTLDNAKIDVVGEAKISAYQIPQGKFTITLENYNNIIDKLLPSHFSLQKSIIKNIIAGATDQSLAKYQKPQEASQSETKNQELQNNKLAEKIDEALDQTEQSHKIAKANDQIGSKDAAAEENRPKAELLELQKASESNNTGAKIVQADGNVHDKDRISQEIKNTQSENIQSENAKFDLEFSKDGIKIGGFNLLNLK